MMLENMFIILVKNQNETQNDEFIKNLKIWSEKAGAMQHRIFVLRDTDVFAIRQKLQ